MEENRRLDQERSHHITNPGSHGIFRELLEGLTWTPEQRHLLLTTMIHLSVCVLAWLPSMKADLGEAGEEFLLRWLQVFSFFLVYFFSAHFGLMNVHCISKKENSQ